MGTNSAVYTARGGAAVTKSDSTVINFRALYVGGAGDVAVQFNDGSTATLIGVGAGSVIPVQGTKVLLTGTTATNIVALF